MTVITKLDEAGNVIGYWDVSLNSWVPKPEEEIEEEDAPEEE